MVWVTEVIDPKFSDQDWREADTHEPATVVAAGHRLPVCLVLEKSAGHAREEPMTSVICDSLRLFTPVGRVVVRTIPKVNVGRTIIIESGRGRAKPGTLQGGCRGQGYIGVHRVFKRGSHHGESRNENVAEFIHRIWLIKDGLTIMP